MIFVESDILGYTPSPRQTPFDVGAGVGRDASGGEAIYHTRLVPPHTGNFHPGPEGAPLGPEGALLGPEGAPSGPKRAPSGPKEAHSGPGVNLPVVVSVLSGRRRHRPPPEQEKRGEMAKAARLHHVFARLSASSH